MPAATPPSRNTAKRTRRITISAGRPLVLAGISAELERGPFEVVGHAQTGRETLALIARVKPEIALICTDIRGTDALALLSRIAREHPETMVVLFAEQFEPAHVELAFSRGASGYLLASIDATDIPDAIRLCAEGSVYYARGLPSLADVALTARAHGVTERELAILKALVRGLSNREISRELWISEQTVKFHLTNIYRKLGIANRVEAARWARDRGLV